MPAPGTIRWPRGTERRWSVLVAAVLLGAALLPAAVAAPAAAAIQAAPRAPLILFVANRSDAHGRGSLRWAVDQINATGGRSGLIVVLPGEYDLTSCGAADDSNRTGDLDALGHGSLTILGVGHVTLKQTCAGQRVLDDHGTARLTLANVTVTGGNVVGIDPTIPTTGGAIRAAGAVTLFAATITGNRAVAPNGADGTATTDAGAGGAAHGGAIAAAGAVVAYASTLSANTAAAGHGGRDLEQDSDKGVGGAASGGAISSAAPVRLIRSTLSGNQALGGAGSLPPVKYTGLGAGAAGGSARGGAVEAQEISALHSRFDSNMAVGGDATFIIFSMASVAYGRPGGAADGGALAASGTLTVTRSSFRADGVAEGTGASSVGSHGGAVATDGAGRVSGSTFDANTASRHGFSADASFGGAISTGAGLALTDDTLRNNQAENGGAVHAAGPLTVSRVSLTANQATKGGAVQADATATVSRSSFTNNHVAVTVGSAGGGLYAQGAVSINRSSFFGNNLDRTSPFPLPLCHFGVCFFGDVGAHGGAVASAVSIHAVASTFSGNAVQGGLSPSPVPTAIFGTATGGALAAPAVVVTDSTITGSRSVQEGFDSTLSRFITAPGHAAAIDGTATTLRHVTLTDSSGLDAIAGSTLSIGATVLHGTAPTGGTECFPGLTTTSEGYNFSDDTSCHLAGVHDMVSTADLLLGPLARNGGPTQTRLPATGSPLIDLIPTSNAALCGGTDQRGMTRPQGSGCDTGSVEVVRSTPG